MYKCMCTLLNYDFKQNFRKCLIKRQDYCRMGRKHPKSLANLLSMDAEMKSTDSNIAVNAY